MKTSSKTLSRLLATSALTAGVTLVPTLAQAAMAPADAVIRNQAEVTFEDSLGNTFTSTSDEASVIVEQIFAATYSPDRLSEESAAGRTHNFAHEIVNNGNGLADYSFSIALGAGGIAGSGFSSVPTAYIDPNCNGQRDASENDDISSTGINNVPAIDDPGTAQIDNRVCIVVQGQLAPGLTNNSQHAYTLTVVDLNGSAVANPTGTVSEATPTNGFDTTEKTVNGIVTIKEAPLTLTKTAVFDEAAQEITYTVNIENAGPGIATKVLVVDAIPALPSGQGSLSYKANSLSVSGGTANSGQGGSNTGVSMSEADIATSIAGVGTVDFNRDGTSNSGTEALIGLDLDSNGTTDGAGVPNGFWVYADSLASGDSMSITFTVSYDNAVAAATVISNTAYFVSDSDGIDGVDPGELPGTATETVTTTMPTTYGFTVIDADNDATLDIVEDAEAQLDTANSNAITAIFVHEITNNANGPDTFTIDVSDLTGVIFDTAGGTLPGTCAVWPGTPSYVIKDNNGNVVSTDAAANYILQAGEVRTFTVEISTTGAAVTTNDYCASVTVASSDTGIGTDEVVLNILEEVVQDPTVDVVDLILTGTTDVIGVNQDATNFAAPDSLDQMASVALGQTLVYTFKISNKSLISESYGLSIGSTSGADANSVLGALDQALQAGTIAYFEDTSGTGSSFTSLGSPNTSAVPPNGEVLVRVEVQVTGDTSKTNADFDFDDSLTGSTTLWDAGEYPVFFRIEGNQGNDDVIVASFVINRITDLSLTPDNSSTISINSTTDYSHVLANNGNTNETVTLAVSNTQNSDFDASVFKQIDSDNDGTPDTNVVAGPLTGIQLSASNTVTVTATSVTEITFDMQPGDTLAFSVTVGSTTSAAPGDQDITTVTLNTASGISAITVTDTSTVVSVALNVTKRVAIDAACDGTPDAAFTVSGSPVAPGECVIWQIVLENTTDEKALNVKVEDQLAEFTELHAGSATQAIESCNIAVSASSTSSLQTECAGPAVHCYHTVDAGDETGTCGNGTLASANSSTVFYNVGPTATTTDGGEIDATSANGGTGPSAFTLRFMVKVDE
ncbi:Uncharacterised protein [BD1-7 clade bacterium]|uniref:DUF11 domain-containing protein n=1 Tax=BD1-7 clade bacterium TaxID=2029982 RepID=A0A5S9PT64_9GAMM|nr:Uncharacterised protein [BD1-7 clade bacterium]